MLHFTQLQTNTLIWGVAIHLIIDWLFQNDWMARNKHDMWHLATYVHSFLHFLGFLLIFSPKLAFFAAILHLIIDTRRPLTWWRKFFHQTTDGPVALHVAIWSDQVAHIAVIAAFAYAPHYFEAIYDGLFTNYWAALVILLALFVWLFEAKENGIGLR